MWWQGALAIVAFLCCWGQKCWLWAFSPCRHGEKWWWWLGPSVCLSTYLWPKLGHSDLEPERIGDFYLSWLFPEKVGKAASCRQQRVLATCFFEMFVFSSVVVKGLIWNPLKSGEVFWVKKVLSWAQTKLGALHSARNSSLQGVRL